jgi:hypothetical protein
MRTTLAFILVASLSVVGCAKKAPPPAAPKAEPSATEKAPDSAAAPAPAPAGEDPCAGGEKMPDKK